jgi:hypothetical protein
MASAAPHLFIGCKSLAFIVLIIINFAAAISYSRCVDLPYSGWYGGTADISDGVAFSGANVLCGAWV